MFVVIILTNMVYTVCSYIYAYVVHAFCRATVYVSVVLSLSAGVSPSVYLPRWCILSKRLKYRQTPFLAW